MGATLKRTLRALLPVSKPAKLSEAPFLPEMNLNALSRFRQQRRPKKRQRSTPVNSSRAGQHHSRQQGRGMELSEIRNYLPGDDIRLMDWKVTARTRRPHTKVFLEERERPVHLVLDLSASMLLGSRRSKAEQALNIAATLGWAFVDQGDRCGGLLFNGRHRHLIRPKAQQKGLWPILKTGCDLGHQLPQEYSRSLPGRMNTVLHQIGSQPGHGHLIILISDFRSLDLTDLSALSRITRHHTLVAISVSDPLEQELPAGPCILTDGHQDHFYDGSHSGDRARYRRKFDQHQQALQQSLHNVRGHFISCSTQDNPADKLKPFITEGIRQR